MNPTTQFFYNTFYRFYPLIDFFLASQKKKLATEINQQKSGNLLEIGVGNGSIFRFYKKHKITGIDISSGMLDVARNQQTDLNINLILMDGENMEFENDSFDYVIINHVLAVTRSPDKMVNGVHRVLKNDGLLFIQNHFTPSHWIKIIDYCFYPFSRVFKFKSVFRPEDVPALQQFKLVKSISMDRIGYFKLLVYAK